jgi:DsbC/DsbD-like thiol-disulfide interchange protein
MAAPGALPVRVRLIGGMLEPAGTLMAGISIALQPGWKTYWRMPGDSGIAPEFTWTRSRNLAGAEVFMPAPDRLSDGFGDILGYHGEVVFPVRVTPVNVRAPVDLVLDLAFGVCERVCIPAQTSASAAIGRASPMAADVAAITASLARVPRPAPAGTAVEGWTVDRAAGEARFRALVPGGARHAVVETLQGPALPLPRIEAHAGGSLSAVVTITAAHKGAARVTVIGAHAAIEEPHTLD